MRTYGRFRRVEKPVQALYATESPEAEILGCKSRLFVKDRGIACRFLVNSGTEVWILFWRRKKRKKSAPFCLYEFNTVNFGPRNTPATFQRFITEELFGLELVFPLLDDFLASSSEKKHK
ncbi:hypothetical protein TNCV_258621 [Trichonephila clavipes]|uniref:Uncharacterized protein n=1 Tax=Trichonephila clavipes TaxID=2585209 RepID=A0A8X6V5A0_TRICX|nr:hypothetical protein TNCV_258621 [Trichonephila clavipes]